MRAKTLLVIPFLLLAGLAQAQSSLEDFCGSLVADSTIEVADDFTSEELQAQLSVMAGLNLLQTDLDFAISMFNEALKVAEEYADEIKSQVADIQNVGGLYGGTINGALFLKNFIDEKAKWVHLDIAGPSWANKPWAYSPKGGTGIMVRTLLRFFSQL